MKATLALAIPLAVSLSAQDSLLEALKKGKVSLEVRTRYEHVEDQDYKSPADHKTANALTNRTILGFESGSLWDAKFTLQAANVASLGDERYNSGLNGKSTFATIQDPTQTELLQAFVSWKGFKAGRQVLSVDTQRFIGPGAWSQMPKAFTGVTYQGKFGTEWMELYAGHLTRLTTSTGINRPMRTEFGRIRFTPWTWLALTPGWFAVQETTAPKTSYQHHTLRADGKWKGFLYEANVSQQRGYKDSVGIAEANHRQGMVGYAWKTVSAKAVHEELEPGFNTPLASLHGYYGWSDRIATTPAKGLVDDYLQTEVKAFDMTFEVQVHQFKAQRDGQAYGKELDFSVTRPITKAFQIMVKFADYKADALAPTNLNKDLRKLWLMTTFKF